MPEESFAHPAAARKAGPGDPAWVRVLSGVRDAIEHVSGAGGLVARYLVLAVFVVGILNVVLRYVGRSTGQNLVSNLYVDLQWQLFALLFLLAVGYGVREGVNPRVDFFSTRFSARTKALIDLGFHALLLLPFVVVALTVVWPFTATALGRDFTGEWDTWQVWRTWEQSPNPAGLPLGPIKLMLTVGFVLLALQLVAEVIKALFVVVGREDLARIETSGLRERVE